MLMRRRGFLKSVVATLIAATALTSAVEAARQGYGLGYDIILQIGDSNSYAGLNVDGSPSYNPAVDTTNPNCFEYRSDNRNPSGAGPAFFFSIVADSFHPFDYAPPGQAVVQSAIDGVGPGESFIQAWQTTFAAPGRKTMIVVLGVGGTGLCNGAGPAWQATAPVGSDLLLAVQKVNLILADTRNRLVVVLWTSGANDAIFEKSTGLSTATYQTAFQNLDSYVRNPVTGFVGTGVSTFVWLIQPLVPAFVTNPGTACPNTNAALSTMPSVVSKCGYADPSAAGLAGNIVGQTAIPFHLSGPSQRLIGSIGFVNAYNTHSP